jgi:hypothetical protein
MPVWDAAASGTTNAMRRFRIADQLIEESASDLQMVLAEAFPRRIPPMRRSWSTRLPKRAIGCEGPALQFAQREAGRGCGTALSAAADPALHHSAFSRLCL